MVGFPKSSHIYYITSLLCYTKLAACAISIIIDVPAVAYAHS